MGGARHVAEDHAEAVIKRHRNAYSVLLRIAERLADEEAIVENTVMRERRPFGQARRPGRILDIHGIIEFEARLARRERAVGDRSARRDELGPIVVEDQRLAQRRAAGPDLGDHFDVIVRTKCAREEEQAHPCLRQRIFDFRRLVSWIEIYQNSAATRRRVLGNHPLVSVG